MAQYIEYILERINAEEKSSLPFLAVISNPTGIIDIPNKVSTHLSFELVCHYGTATIQEEGCSYLLSCHEDLPVLSTDTSLQICFSSDFQGHLMIQTKEFCNSIVEMDRYAVTNYYRFPISINLTEEQDKQYYFFFEWLKYAIRKNPEDAENRMRHLLRAAFYVFSDYKSHTAMKDEISSRNDQITSQFLKALEDDHEIGDEHYYCEKLKVSPRTLSRAVKFVTGQSLSKHITNQKVTRAKKTISSMSINTPMVVIAEQLGYSSLPSFSRFFKTHTGLTPKQFKNSLK